jgi:hypothetical protein
MTDLETSDCCACECDYDSNRVWNTRRRKARKPHRCEECNELIETGTTYVYATFLSADCDWGDYTVCVPCWRISRDLGQCCILGNLRDHLRECLGFDYVTGEPTPDFRNDVF